MPSKSNFIVEYIVGDGCTYSATETKAVLAESKAAFMSELELCLAAYEPGKSPEYFACAGQTFPYNGFIYHSEKQISPRRTKDVYDYLLPTVMTFEEWAEASFKVGLHQMEEQTERLATRQRVEDLLKGPKA